MPLFYPHLAAEDVWVELLRHDPEAPVVQYLGSFVEGLGRLLGTSTYDAKHKLRREADPVLLMALKGDIDR